MTCNDSVSITSLVSYIQPVSCHFPSNKSFTHADAQENDSPFQNPSRNLCESFKSMVTVRLSLGNSSSVFCHPSLKSDHGTSTVCPSTSERLDCYCLPPLTTNSDDFIHIFVVV